MADPISSPGDPLFYLHHSFLDRLWWKWQEQDLSARLTDIAGATVPNGAIPVTLDDQLSMLDIVPNATVGDVMDIGGDRLCFEYIDPY
jgi:tyrosinase